MSDEESDEELERRLFRSDFNPNRYRKPDPPAPPPPPAPVILEPDALQDAWRNVGDCMSRYERDFFRERWFASEQGLIYFAWEAVRTLDEHDADNPIKPLPRELYLLDHFQNLLRERRYVVLKSRQIMITWATFIYIVWEIMRLPYRKIGLVPKKSDDGKDHMEDRIYNIIWAKLPQWLRDDFPEPQLHSGFLGLKYHARPPKWATGYDPKTGWLSWIGSFEKGPHQLRQYTLSHIFWDEMAVQDHARKAWQAAMPTIGARGKGKGGKVIAVSTMVPGSFHDVLCGDPVATDNAVEISLGNMPLPSSGYYKSPLPGVVHYHNPKYGTFVAVYSFLADSQKRAAEWEQQESRSLGGPTSPEWLLDFRMQRQAFRGILVYPHYNRAWNVVPARQVNRECEIFLSFDFGHTNPTAVLFWEWDEHSFTLTCFAEIYITTTAVGVVKHLIQQELATHLRMPFDEVVFSEVLGQNVGDPAAPGTALEYGQEPNPLFITGNVTADAGTKPWRINDRAAGEARLDSALRPVFICCGVRQYALDGEQSGRCGSLTILEDGTKAICNKEHRAYPILQIMEGRAPNLEREFPIQQRSDPNDPSLESPETNKKGVPNHATDSARYATMRYQSFLGIEAPAERRPRYMTANPDKLTTVEKFNRERWALAEESRAMSEAVAEVGEIDYPDDAGDEEEGAWM